LWEGDIVGAGYRPGKAGPIAAILFQRLKTYGSCTNQAPDLNHLFVSASSAPVAWAAFK